MFRVVWLSGLVSISLFAIPAWAGDEPGVPQPPAAEATKAEAEDPLSEASVDDLIKQLDSNKFSERQAASNELARRGVKGVAGLEKAAMGSSREPRLRALEILKRHYQDGAGDLKKSAEQALQRIAKSESPSAASARQIVAPAPPAAVPPARNRLNGLRIQLVPGANVRRMAVKNVNGVKEIDIDENGRKIKIKDDPKNGIQIEVTEKKDGKEKVSKYAAKDADELKKKHPEGHKIYEKYGKQNGAIGRIQIQAIQRAAGGVLPVRPAAPRMESRQDVAKRLDKINKQLQDVEEQLRKLQPAEAQESTDAFQKLREQIKQTQKQLEEAQSKLWPVR